ACRRGRNGREIRAHLPSKTTHGLLIFSCLRSFSAARRASSVVRYGPTRTRRRPLSVATTGWYPRFASREDRPSASEREETDATWTQTRPAEAGGDGAGFGPAAAAPWGVGTDDAAADAGAGVSSTPPSSKVWSVWGGVGSEAAPDGFAFAASGSR